MPEQHMKITLENSPKNYDTIITEISTGQVKIPQFQRQFVWDIIASAKLIDSILKGYPIGTFIFWRTDEQLRSVRNIGGISLPQQNSGEFVNYVLDGQQRITSFYAAVKGQTISRDSGRSEDFSMIHVDLGAKPDEEFVVTDVSNKPKGSIIKLTDLMEGSFDLLASFPKEHQDKIKHFQNILKGYSFNIVNLKNASIDVATEVFTRLNVGGKPLSLFEIMVAKTYDSESQFDLSETYEQLKKELEKCQYDDIPSATVLQVVSILLAKDIKRSTILKLDKKKFIEKWPVAVDCIKKAIDFFRGYGVVVSRLLPYPALIITFSYFFYKHGESPKGSMKRMLEDFFWRASLGTRYSSGVESKMIQDIEKIDKIIRGELPKYEWSIDVSPEYLMRSEVTWFSTGRSLVKAILCILAIKKPKSFDSNQDVIIDNSWLKVSTSKNYHHFFPRAFMKRTYPEMEYGKYNNVLNITIVDDFLNKSRIKAKSPSVYMKKFKKENPDIKETMKTHLIGDFDRFGITTDDYDKFFNKRANWISKELKKRIIVQETGLEEQLEISDAEQGEYFETETTED